jgi:2-oxoglutarate dehydrogenase E2 component (dihydrolipoamide succinyltransferase)
MIIEIKVPEFPESITEGVLLNWYKKPGDPVEHDENLIDLETDKAIVEVTSPSDGILKEIKLQDNSTVHGGEIIALIEAGEVKDKIEKKPERDEKKTETIETKEAKTEKPRIVIQTRPEIPHEPAFAEERIEKRIPMTKLRLKIAERLKQSQNTAAILTTFNEINMKPVMDLRERYKTDFLDKYGVKLGLMSFFVKASIEALKQFPLVNASIDGTDIVYHGYMDIGIAVSTERGLVVPSLRDADQMSFDQIEKKIREFGEKGKNHKLEIEELTGGTFTITNGGVFGSLLSTPILNPPQSAILGMHKIEDRPVAENGNVVIRPMMYAALSYDHRIIDGAESVQFLKFIKKELEDPARMLLQI